MTVETTTTIAGPYPTNGVATAFPFSFRALSADEVQVVREVGGVEVTVSPSLYKVQLSAQSGTVVFDAPPAAGANIYVLSDPDFKQNISFSNQSAFLPSSHNEANDRSAIRAQVLADQMKRAPVLPLDPSKAAGLFPKVLADGSWGYEAAGPGATGPANNTYTSYAALQASDPTRKYAYLVGDTDSPPRPDGAYSNLTGAAGAWVRTDDLTSVGFAGAAPTTAGSGPDAAPFIRQAIQFAATRNNAVVTLPGGTGFIYRCDTAIWDTRIHGPFPRNVRFTGLARNPSGYVGGPSIRYTGADTLFYLDFNTGNDECGNYSFTDLTFEATNATATIFDWNDPRNYTPGDGDGKAYIRGLVYDRCHFYGPQAGAAQTGDGIRGAKLFDLDVRKGCYIRGFRRGLWAKGCDNLRYDARTNYNGRNIMLEGASPFSSGAHINTEWIGESTPASETAFPIWDSAIAAKYFGCLVEQITPGNAEALIYLNGVGTQLWGFGGAGAPMFRLGPNARDIDWYNPSVPQNAAYAPIIDAPVNDAGVISWDFGDPQQQRSMRLHGADLKTQITLGRNGRLQYRGQSRGQGAIPVAQDLLVDGAGARNRQTVVTALDYWGKSNGTVHSGGIQLVADANAFGGWAIRLVNGQASAGFVMTLRIGDQVGAERLLMRVNARVTAGDGYGYTVRRNGTITAIVGLTFAGGGYSMQDAPLDFSGFAVGDTVEIGIGAVGPTGGDMFVNAASVNPVSANIADLAVLDGNSNLAAVIQYLNNNVLPAVNAHNALARRFMRIG